MTALYSLKGKKKGTLKLPGIFDSEYRPDLIQRAFVVETANNRQSYRVHERAGLETSADYFGRRRDVYRMTINRGMSRLPREKPGGGGLGKVRRVPQSVGGRRAHPPVGKKWGRKINRKEYLLALKAALSATKNPELISARGHRIGKIVEFPLVIEDSFENLSKTKDIINSLKALGLEEELERGRAKKIRAGKGKSRGRKYKRKKSLLIVVNNDKIKKAAGNISGVDIAKWNELTLELLAPGSHPGRLTLWTKSAIENIDKLGEKDES